MCSKRRHTRSEIDACNSKNWQLISHRQNYRQRITVRFFVTNNRKPTITSAITATSIAIVKDCINFNKFKNTCQVASKEQQHKATTLSKFNSADTEICY
jgi:hypothetical protein